MYINGHQVKPRYSHVLSDIWDICFRIPPFKDLPEFGYIKLERGDCSDFSMYSFKHLYPYHISQKTDKYIELYIQWWNYKREREANVTPIANVPFFWRP